MTLTLHFDLTLPERQFMATYESFLENCAKKGCYYQVLGDTACACATTIEEASDWARGWITAHPKETVPIFNRKGI